MSSTVTGAKDAVTNTVTGMVDKTKEAVQGGVEMTRSAVATGVNTVMGSSVGQMVASSVDAVLGKSEELVELYLPMTDEELGEMADVGGGVSPFAGQVLKVAPLARWMGKLRAKAKCLWNQRLREGLWPETKCVILAGIFLLS